MRLSNKSTFSLACLILLLAFVAVPVMAHQLTEADVPGTAAEKTAAVDAHNEDPHDPTDTTVAENHALVKSIAVSSTYLTTSAPITATVTFADGVAAIADDTNTDDTVATTGDDNEARHATLSDPATDLAVGTLILQHGTRQTDGTYTWATADSTNGARITQVIKTTVEGTGDTGSGSVYTVYISVPAVLTSPDNGKYRIFAQTDVSSAGGIYNPGTATMPNVKGEFTMDTVSPVVGTVNVGPQPGGDLIPVSGQLSDPFRLTFDVAIPDPTDTDPSDGTDTLAIEDLKSITFMAEPAHLTFGTPGSLGGMQYAVDVGYKNVTVAAGTEVTITITATDNADNTATATTTVTLAARTMTQTPAMIPTKALGSTTAGGTLTVTFDKDPGTVATTATGYMISTAAGLTRTITVPADKAAGDHSIALTWDNNGSGTVTYTIDPIVANESSEITIEAGGFVVVVRNTALTAGSLAARLTNRFGAANITLVPWSAMPDLQNIFDTGVPLTGPAHGGGALILKQSGDSSAEGYVALNPGTVGISEIMWAIDLSQLNDATARSADQWIELHNLNTTAATVKLSWKTGAKDIAGDTNINGDLAAPYLDVVTNVFHDRAGNRNGPWVLPGQNGNPLAGTNFVSAARKGTFNLTSQHQGKHNKRYTRTGNGNSANSPDGRNKDQWEASTFRYDLRSETIALADGRTINVVYEDYGTPGHPNTVSPERAPVVDARTEINPGGIIINEVANRDEEQNQYEWIELRNVGADEINLNNYQISILTAAGSDKPFIYLSNNNNAKIPAGGVLLLVDSDPFGDLDHPLAVGWNVDKNAEDQVPGLASLGISATSKEGRYKVVQFGQSGSDYEDGLPDDGNFILVVRRPDNHEGDHGHGGKGRADLPTDVGSGDRDLDKIVDIAGYAPGLNTGLGYKNAISQTHLWPLKNQGAPDDKNRLSENKVRQRQHVKTRDGRAGTGNTHNDRKAGQIAFGDIGYTGVGYRRQASNSNIHGGTPGYDNGARKGRVSDLAMTKLVISEIMLSQGEEGGRTTLPQWIEIYNPSTHPVSLGGWRLIIENPRDPIRTINLGGGTVKTILSKQTILVISGSARDIGSDTLPSSTVFPATRVYNVYQHQRNEFNMTSRFDPILNEEAFHITLIDGAALDLGNADQKAIADDPTKSLRVGGSYYTISDAIGNLDGDPRTNDTPEDNGKAKFTKGMTADGERTSLIRIFDKGVARDGTGAVKPLGGTDGVDVARMRGIDSKYSWVHAADTRDRFVRHTWYGDESDWGTPADRGGQILPVELSFFRPTLQDGKVTVRWTTESELDNAGFNILRSETRNGEYKQVNTELIQGAGTTGERTTYNWVDPTAKPGVVYYYQIEDVSFAGEHQVLAMTKLKGLISAEGKLTTTWSELKQASQ